MDQKIEKATRESPCEGTILNNKWIEVSENKEKIAFF